MSRLKAPQRREQLIEVATKLFAKYGYEATTTSKIAQAAGVTEPILYRHFKDKHAMFVAIVQAMSQTTLRHWDELIAGIDDPARRVRRIAEEFPGHVKKLSDAYHVIHGALATPPRDEDGRPKSDVTEVIRGHYARIEEFFTAIVREGQNRGHFHRLMDPRVPAWQLINIGIGYAMVSLNVSQFDHSLIEQAIEFILRGLKTEG